MVHFSRELGLQSKITARLYFEHERISSLIIYFQIINSCFFHLQSKIGKNTLYLVYSLENNSSTLRQFYPLIQIK